MPIRVQNDLPVKEILESENIFVMDEHRATHQDIRPIKIGLLNLMPLKEETELQILRSLSNTPLQVDVTFVAVASHQSKNTSKSHLNKFYQTFDEIKDRIHHHRGTGRTDAVRRSGLLGRTDTDYGLDKDKCRINIASLLGSSGRNVLSLWNR